MQPHKLKGNRCVNCGVVWSGLTDRDRVELSTQGLCLGRIEVWVRCKRYINLFCLGDRHEECRYSSEQD